MSKRMLLYPVAGFLLLLCAWQIAARSGVLGQSFPALGQVLRVFADDARRALLMRSAAATLSSAASGYAVGIVLGAAVGVLAQLLPPLRAGLDRLAVLVNALPVIALAPVLIITAGRMGTPTALAAVPVFFLLYTSTRAGLQNASAQLESLFTTLGANRWQRLAHLQALAALPAVLSGMKIAVGSAMIGAIVGEWFGAPSGLGVVVLNSMQNFQIPLLWASVFVIAAITLCGYAVLTLLEHGARHRVGA